MLRIIKKFLCFLGVHNNEKIITAQYDEVYIHKDCKWCNHETYVGHY